ncbi:hypothetical protein N7527_003317 [Penicillium freii]|uniref:Uncharacterized protein n=1 Tax=Penicillium freii TaxID=48697 RepID=A0A101MDY9_PENFR|nr:hypothetical protein N7527_003317 [Penicillium freii]KUM58816.1 hypothetical protein ACN42_g8333 [Penicillium freii]
MVCHFVVLEAKEETTGTGLGKLLVYMAMARASRKARGQSDSAVWGALTDRQWFYFVRLNNAGQCHFAKEISKKSSYLISKNLSPTSDIPLFCF